VCVFMEVCVPYIFNQTPAGRRMLMSRPRPTLLLGLWAIPSTESGPQPLLETYNPSSLTVPPSPPPLYVCMYVGMIYICCMYVGMYWVIGGQCKFINEEEQ
jgi:hypothetical protein